ncbi:Protein CLEC-11 [Aphelenchoides avenae]|nr:Protein CLEC-11 [Aphelenchus avenae]
MPAPPQCGAGWKRFRDSCYKVTSSNILAGVESECERKFEGALASVHDEEENAFLSKFVRVEHGAEEEFYIGLTHNRTAHWTWLDGSSFDFTAWGSSEPNETDNHCVQVHSAIGPTNGRWEAVDCSSQRPAVCERHVETFVGSAKQPSSRLSRIPGCPKNYYCGSGIITSPNYPFHYGNNENKTYHLRASSPDGLIVLTFVPIELDYSGDHVKVYDGPSVSGSPMRT